VGVAYALSTAARQRLGVVEHRDGRRDLVIYDPQEPDSALHTAALTESEARTVAELLGAPVYVNR
jgi:TrkA domain protein